MVNWPEVIAALADSAYTGWLSLEDLYGVNLETTGFVDDRLPSEPTASVSIKQKLIGDLAFLKRLSADNRNR